MSVRVQPTEYRVVDDVIADDFEASSWTITVAWRGPGDLWAVMLRSSCWNRRTRAWDYEPNPSSRTAAFKRAHRFPLDVALDIAKKQAPLITVMGKTATEVMAWKATLP